MGCGRNNFESSSSHGNHHGHKDGCVCEVVKTILAIQNEAVNDECDTCTTSCFLEPLGGIVSPARSTADTRVFMLLTKTGAPFFAHFKKDNCDEYCTSVFFRVEDVFDDCCATLRVLLPLDENGDIVDLLNEDEDGISLRALCEVVDYDRTESCITVDLDCFCGVQCVADVDLGICD